MTADDLGRRMGITGASVRSLEKKEEAGGVRLDSLRRAAEAMDCTLVYAFVPNTSLEDTVRRRAVSLLEGHLARVRQTMALEAQEATLAESAIEDRVQEIIDAGRLWSERGLSE